MPKIFDNWPRVIGWKYPTAINTIASNSDRAAAPPLVGADKARIVSANRERVRCCRAVDDRYQLVGSVTQLLDKIIDQQIDTTVSSHHPRQCLAADRTYPHPLRLPAFEVLT
ncbi:UNVERIFIED_ORG: hypothetical protein J2W66_002658 [Agrobacterium larrymoorei]|nr:hypothetical protein [Agrobacterium larrymoorei]